MTVGHIEQMAMVKSAAASDGPKRTLPPSVSLRLLKRTNPSGNQASGETGRRTSMIGSSALLSFLDKPSRNPSGVPMHSAITYPWRTSLSDSQVNRRMPWSISPRFANGSVM